MAVLPKSRVVDVTVTRQDNFPTITGFGTPLIVTDETPSGSVIDATTRTKTYASMDEVSADWDSSDEAYKVANTMFSQPVRPTRIKVGFRESGTGDLIDDQMDAITAYDNDFYQVVPTNHFRGDADEEDRLIAWTESKNKIGFLGAVDPLLKNPADTTNVAARNKGEYDRTAVFYNADPDEYLEAAVAAYTATRNFDRPDTAYTAKFKRMRGISALNEASSVVEAITGFVPALGQNTTTGHLANVFVNIGGSLMLVEGNVLSGAFIDEIHAADWLIARTQEELIGILATNDRIPMTDPGVEILASGVRAVMNRATDAGLIAEDEDDEGNLVPAYEITPTRVTSISAAQRRNRIAPPISGLFRYAGACHYATVAFTMTF
jgi:hypothetical protein